jgi:hypothetical protein
MSVTTLVLTVRTARNELSALATTRIATVGSSVDAANTDRRSRVVCPAGPAYARSTPRESSTATAMRRQIATASH